MTRQVHRMKLKVCVVGDRTVGKTSLVRRYVYESFDDVYRGTLGADVHRVNFMIPVAADDLVEAEVALFDFMGERAMRDAFRDAIFWGSHGFLALTDLTRPETLHSLPDWINAVVGVAGDVPYAVVLNKADLVRSGSVGPEQTGWLLERLPRAPFFLTSARTGEGVEQAVERVVNDAVDRVLARSRTRKATEIVGERILQFARRRGATGVAQRELLLAIKGMDPARLADHVDKLRLLGLVEVEAISPTSFRVVLTEAGEEAAGSLEHRTLVVEEPT